MVLALGWLNPQGQHQAHLWFAIQSKNGWGTCALTQLGFIRLSANPADTESAVTLQEAAGLLKQWT